MQRIFGSKGNRGSVLVLAAVSLVGLVGMAAITVDIGRLYAAKGRAQDICDASALAGGHFLDGTTTGEAAATTAASSNAASNVSSLTAWPIYNASSGGSAGVAIDFPTSVTTAAGDTFTVSQGEAIRVEGWVQVEYGLANIFNVGSSGRAKASAIAILSPLSSAGAPMPFVISENTANTYTAAQEANQPPPEYPLKVGSWQEDPSWLGGGNFGLVDLDGNGGSNIADQVAGTADVTISLENNVYLDANTKPGENTGPLDHGMETRLSGTQYANDAYDSWVDAGMPSDPRVVIIPIAEVDLDAEPVNGSQPLRIVGFAAFYIDDYSFSPQNKYLSGIFVEAIYFGDGEWAKLDWLNNGSIPLNGIRVPKLVS